MVNVCNNLRELTHDVIPLISISKITSIFYFEFSDEFVSDNEYHNFYELVYVDKGEILQTIGNVAYEMEAGDFILIRPNDVHQLYSYMGTKPNAFIITFVSDAPMLRYFENKKSQMPRHLRRYIADIIAETRYTYAAPCLEPNMPILHTLEDELPGGEQMIQTYLEQLFIKLYRIFIAQKEISDLETMETAAEETSNEIVNQMIRNIRENPMKPLTPSIICCMQEGYSNSYLSTLFRKYCSCSLVEYIHRVKIEEAKRMIRQRRYNFTGIATLLCYSDLHYFSRVFQRVTGMSPSEYQKSLQLSNTSSPSH